MAREEIAFEQLKAGLLFTGYASSGVAREEIAKEQLKVVQNSVNTGRYRGWQEKKLRLSN